ncbi:MAG: ATP-binding protein [Nitrospinae bacterium]|nr:ATP-binding protein [Nitrospinota bacterium]
MRSLKARLGLGLALSLITLFALQWFAVTHYMRSLVEGYASSRLSHDMDNILAGVSFAPDGSLEIRRESVDPIYQRPFSGHYYLIHAEPSEPLRSRSLWDTQLDFSRPQQGKVELAHVKGPSGQTLLSMSGGFVKSGRSVVITVAEDISSIESQIGRFRARYAVGSLIALLVVIVLQTLIVKAGLSPLARAKDDLGRLERGETDSITENIPTEALPLVREINRLLGALRERLRRSRESSGNMAHALKTPLSALQQILESEGAEMGDGTRKRIESYFAAIMERMERELSRARLAGGNAPGRMFDAEADLPDIVETLERIYREKNIAVTWSVEPGAVVHMDREDALELVGVLMDNACKWAVKRANIGVRKSGGSVLLVVEDDGPGLPEEDIAKIARRGVRLDESATGHGLGLSIASDIVESYAGAMEFGRSQRLKGFEVRVNIPKATHVRS